MESLVTYTWSAVILWIGVYQSALLVPVLWFRKQGPKLANRLLAAFVLVMGIRILITILEFSNNVPKSASFFGLGGLVILFYSPLFYFYLKSLIEREFRFRKVHAWHLVPVWVLVGLHQWFFFQNPSFGRTILDVAREGIPPPIEIRLMGGLVISIFLTYLFLVFRLLSRYRQYVKSTASFSDTLHFRWVLFLVVVMLLPVIIVVLTVITLGRPGWVPYPAYGVSLMVTIIGVVVMVRSEVLNGIPDVLMVDEEEELTPQRYESSALDDPQKRQIQQQLLAFMEKEQPYLTHELTLNALASQLGVNAKYLSQVINELQDQNFMDFINGYRIRRAQEMLLNPAYHYFTILAIAQEAGFKSKSSFYNAFKKVTGMTPSGFKRENERMIE